MATDEWDEEQSDPSRRPSDVSTAVRLLAGCIAFHVITIAGLWSRLGLEWVVEHRTAWIDPFTVTLAAILIALVWRGNSWARTMVLIAIGADALRTVLAASVLFALGGVHLLGLLSWGSLLAELFAAYFLLQSDSLEWFHRSG